MRPRDPGEYYMAFLAVLTGVFAAIIGYGYAVALLSWWM